MAAYAKEKGSQAKQEEGNKADMTDLAKYAGGELLEIVANYEWRPKDHEGNSYGVKIKIRVYQKPGGRFMAYPSHRVKTPQQGSPYMSIEDQDSIEKAMRDCIGGFKAFMGSVEETEWPENEDF